MGNTLKNVIKIIMLDPFNQLDMMGSLLKETLMATLLRESITSNLGKELQIMSMGRVLGEEQVWMIVHGKTLRTQDAGAMRTDVQGINLKAHPFLVTIAWSHSAYTAGGNYEMLRETSHF